MATSVKSGVPWRILGWGSAVLLLAIPFAAMRFTSEVKWTVGDFLVAGALFAIIGGLLELAIWASSNWAYRAGAALGLLGFFLIIWANLAVGIVGSEDNSANILFFAAPLLGIVVALVARFRAEGMAAASIATAFALGVAFVVAVNLPTDEPFMSHWVELAGTAAFAALFLASAALFHKAARHSSSSS